MSWLWEAKAPAFGFWMGQLCRKVKVHGSLGMALAVVTKKGYFFPQWVELRQYLHQCVVLIPSLHTRLSMLLGPSQPGRKVTAYETVLREWGAFLLLSWTRRYSAWNVSNKVTTKLTSVFLSHRNSYPKLWLMFCAWYGIRSGVFCM